MSRFSAFNGKAILFFLFLWFLWFINFTSRTIFSPLLPLVEDEFLISHARASSIFPVISFGYAFSLLLAMFSPVQIGTRKSISLCFLIVGVAIICIPLARSFTVIYAFAFLLGVGVGLYLPNAIPVITDCYPEKYWGRALSVHDSATSISIFASPIIALFLLQLMSWRGVLQVLGCICFGCAALFYTMGHEVKVVRPGNRFHAELFGNKSLWMIGVIWIFATGCNLGLYYVTPLYFIKELGIPAGYTNALLGASRLGGVVVAVSAGFAADRLSLRKTASLVILATGISTMALAIPNIAWIKIDLFLQAAISTAFFPLSLVAISRMFGPETRGPATAFIIMLAVVFGIGVTPYLLGICGDLISFRFGILVLGSATAVSSLLFATMKNL